MAFIGDETGRFSLSDCGWYDVLPAQRPWWVKGDCGGRMDETEFGPICENHHNQWLKQVSHPLLNL